MPANPVDGNDTRRYSKSRVWSGFGYDHPPTVLSGLSFRFHKLTRCSTRDVQLTDGRRWELWSPNSAILPYLPGSKSGHYEIGIPVIEEDRRTDGHLGRFDPTISPQYYCSDLPWLGYIKRAEKLTSSDIALLPEYWPVHQHWESDCKPAKFTGRLSTAMLEALRARNLSLDEHIRGMEKVAALWPLIWELRPELPNQRAIEDFSLPTKYEVAVDEVVGIQRGSKMKAAWVVLARLRLEKGRKELEQLQWCPIPDADDSYMGVWLNTALEQEALQIVVEDRVPGYIVHEYVADIDFPATKPHVADQRNPVCSPNFMEGTSIEFAFSRGHNGFEELRKRFNGSVSNPSSLPRDARVGTPFKSMVIDCIRSSSWYNGGRANILAMERDMAGSRSAAPNPGASLSWADAPPDCRPKDASYYTAPPITTVVLSADRMPWVRPPPIQVTASGKWANWVHLTLVG